MSERAQHRHEELVSILDIEKEINDIAEANPPNTNYAVLAEIHTLIKHATHIRRSDAEILRTIIHSAIGSLKVFDDDEPVIPLLHLYREKRAE